MRIFFATLLIVFGVSSVTPIVAYADGARVARDVQAIVTQYSRYLDDVTWGAGWYYTVPSNQYKEIDQSSEQSIRMQATFATAYQYRQDPIADQLVHDSIVSVLGPGVRLVNSVPVKGKRISTRGFGDMIGMYLALRILDGRPDIFTPDEQRVILANIRAMYPWALKGNDTENRALIGAAYGVAILNHPRMAFLVEDRVQYEDAILAKVVIGLRSIDQHAIYREGKKREFSLHYHLVSAHMLAYIGRMFDDIRYTVLAKKMFQYVHNRYPRGQITWRGSNRPRGIGLQTVLLRALGERELGNPEWWRYWDTERKGRGAVDKDNPGRLVWRDEADKTVNDDYSFVSMAVLLKL